MLSISELFVTGLKAHLSFRSFFLPLLLFTIVPSKHIAHTDVVHLLQDRSSSAEKEVVKKLMASMKWSGLILFCIKYLKAQA